MLTGYQNHHNIFYTEWDYLFTSSLDMTFDLILKYKCHDQIVLSCVHYSLHCGQSWKLLLHLPHELIRQLSPFSAVFNSKHSLISEIWPQQINCDLILSCFQSKSRPYQKYDHKQLTAGAGNMQPVWCLMLFQSMKYDFAVRYVIIWSFGILVWKIWHLSLHIDSIFQRRSVIAPAPP